MQGFGDDDKGLQDLSTPDRPGLPSGWNRVQDVYSLQYKHIHTKHMCLVKAIPMGVQLLISAVVSICVPVQNLAT